MTKIEKALEREFADIYELIEEINEVSARLLARAKEARQALGAPPEEESDA